MTRNQELAVIAVLALVGVATLIDIAFDLYYGSTLAHISIELVLVMLSVSGVLWLLQHLHLQNRALEQIKQEIAEEKEKKPEAPAAGHEARRTLSEIMRQQFQSWRLTVGEQEVAILLLKGLSFKEIAGVRETREKTVRQQASSIYKKAGVSGRHAFAAWFIEDFL
jgi:DNA-binding NarL/FixJ family response regulator